MCIYGYICKYITVYTDIRYGRLVGLGPVVVSKD